MEKDLRNISDAYGWARDTAQALRAGNLAAVDMDKLIEHIEYVESSFRRELISLLMEIIDSLLVLNYTDDDRKDATRQLVHAQGQLRLLLFSTPSIQEAVPEAIDRAYERAKKFVTEYSSITLPARCPFPWSQIAEDPYERLIAKDKLAS